jgi:hypothetical protein
MQFIVRPLVVLAGLGLLASLGAHVAGLLGISLDSRVFVLHGGIFVVWLPTVFLVMRISRNYARPTASRWMNWNSTGAPWRALLSGCPAWMRIGVYVVFAYALVNFFVFAVLQSNSNDVEPEVSDMVSPAVLRGFSGHWLVFYYAAFAVGWSVMMKPQLLQLRTCGAGHRVAADDRFCATCGSALESSNPR